MTTKTVPITKNVEIKRKYTDADKLALLEQITEADKVVKAKQYELAGLQDSVKSLKEAIAGQYEIISDLCDKYRLGYESKWTECSVTYADGIATFVDKNGVIVEQREISEEEQLQLNSGFTDAENIIRQASKEEDEE